MPAVLAKNELVIAMPKAGDTFFYIDRNMGPRVETVGELGAWFSLIFKSALALADIGTFALLINDGLTQWQMKLIAVIFSLIFTAVNIRGIEHSGMILRILLAVLIGVLVFYIFIGIFYFDKSHYSNFVPHDKSSIFLTAGIVFVSYCD